MDNERIIRIIKRVNKCVIEEKMESFKSYLLRCVLDDPDSIGNLDMMSLYLKESVMESPKVAGDHVKKAMLYMNKQNVSDIVRAVATYSKNGIEFLRYINNNIEMDKEESRRMYDFIRITERTNELIEKGYKHILAKQLSSSQTDILKIDDNEEITLVRSGMYTSDGVTLEGEEVVYQELINTKNNKKYFVAFFIKGNSYLRYIGEIGSNLVHVVNENGTFEEFQNKTFKISPVARELETELLSKNPYYIPESDPNARVLENNRELVLKVYEEINELAEFDGESYKAEEILNKKMKNYRLN